MRLEKLTVSNYRTLEDLVLDFPSYYSAICGRNDSGKTNVVRAIRCLMKEDEPYGRVDEPEFSLEDDYTKWLEEETKDRRISVGIGLEIFGIRLLVLVVALAIGFLSGCAGSGDDWEDADSVVFALALPDTVKAGQSISARITGASGCPPCCRFDGVTVAEVAGTWVLEPRSRCKQHPSRPCPACDYFFDEAVTIPGQDSGFVRVRAVSYGHDLVDSVVVLRR